MIACVCNNISEVLVRHSIDEGARTYEEVMDLIDIDPVCETCRAYIAGIIDAVVRI